MEQVTIRITPERLGLIDRAAAVCGVNRSEFMLQASELAALDTLTERPVIALDNQAYDDFAAELATPVQLDARLSRRLFRPPLWER